VGAAKFIRGLVRCIDPARLTVVVNTGDDETFYGLHVSPDIDTVTYTLAGAVNRAQGWGLAGETFNVLPRSSVFTASRGSGSAIATSPRIYIAPSGCAKAYHSAESPRKSRTHSR